MMKKCIFLLLFVLSSPVAAERKNFLLVEGMQDSGLWLTATSWAGSDVSNDALVKRALKVNSTLVEYSHVKQLDQKLVASDLASLDVRRTPALLPVDASSASYKSFWRWGNDVLLEVDYVLPSRSVPWRTDYRCENSKDCRLLTEPKDQFFELSYFLYKNNGGSTRGTVELDASNKAYALYRVFWQDPVAVPTYRPAQASAPSYGLIWTLKVLNVGASIARGSDGLFSSPQSTGSSALLVAQLNSLLADKDDILKEEYDNPIDKSGYAFFKREVNNALRIQASERILYQEQIVHMVDNWESVEVVAELEMEGRGFIFVQPTLRKSPLEKITARASAAVTVFEYEKEGSQKLTLGVKTDWIGALLSNDYLLESIRLQSGGQN